MKQLNLLFILLLMVSSATAQELSSLIAKNSQVELIATGYSFTEGPAVAPNGEIFFTDQPNNAIYIWNEKKEIRRFDVDGERANGLYFDADGNLVACADYRNKLLKIGKDGKKTVLADSYNGKHLNGPNDLWIHPNGNIYMTDSYYHRPWWPEDHKQEQDTRGVYCLYPDGKLVRLIDDYKMPNGIIGTPDGKILYVADIQDRKIWKYNIGEDGKLSDKTFFAPEGSDGMTIDEKGNVYLTNKAVSVFAPDGHKIGDLTVPEQPANVTFGGKDRKTLFITARTSVYKIRMNVKGVR
jgi:gluconolactonase